MRSDNDRTTLTETDGGSPIPRTEKRRVCKYPGCCTVLNPYNRNDACFAHAVKYAEIMENKLIDMEHERLRCIQKRILTRQTANIKKKLSERVKQLNHKIARFKVLFYNPNYDGDAYNYSKYAKKPDFVRTSIKTSYERSPYDYSTWRRNNGENNLPELQRENVYCSW